MAERTIEYGDGWVLPAADGGEEVWADWAMVDRGETADEGEAAVDGGGATTDGSEGAAGGGEGTTDGSGAADGAEAARPVARRRAGLLRRELSARNLVRAQAFAHETTIGAVAAVVYAATADGSGHGNFFPASYRRIAGNAAWAARLEKAYTASGRIARGRDRQRRELECANSSDALLMNVFCHPTVLRSGGMRALLGVDAAAVPEFGVRVRVPLRGGHDDRTEMDMVLRGGAGDLLVEAKLSESDFQRASPVLMDRYAAFESAFDVAELPRVRGQLRSYQLLRCVLAAEYTGARFAVMLDARRTDLLEDIFVTYRAVRDAGVRSRLHVVTWQQIAACVPRTLQAFLAEKYGIDAAR